MTHTYKVSGMTCSSCLSKVQELLLKLPGVKNVRIDLSKGEATIDMNTHIATADFKTALKDYPKYQLTEANQPHYPPTPVFSDEEKNHGL